MDLAPLFALFLFCNCQKTTTAKGKVYNYLSGKPVVGAKVFLTGYDGNKPRDSTNPDPCEMVETTTDANGEYELEVGCSGMDKVSIRTGYPNSPFSNGFYGAWPSEKIRLGKCNEIDFKVDSIDGGIKFALQNEKAVDDSIYLTLHCNGIGPVLMECGGQRKIVVPAGQTRYATSLITANRYVKYYWDKAPFTKVDYALHKDSIYCAKNDSTLCTISF